MQNNLPLGIDIPSGIFIRGYQERKDRVMASTANIGNPVYIVRRRGQTIGKLVRATSENRAVAKVMFKDGSIRSDYFVYQY